MKRIVFLIAVLLAAGNLFALTPAPITGSSFVCSGSTTTLSDATTGGTWSSSTPSVAVIDAATGVVSAVSLGTTVITYTAGSGYVTKLITVKEVPTLTPSSINACVNSTYTTTPSIPGGSWSSATPAIATVNSIGIITGVAPGTTTIQYTAAGGCSTTATITVNSLPLPITGSNVVYTGTTTTLSDGTGGGAWSTSDPFRASVNSAGVVTGISAGIVYMSYTAATTCSSIFKMEVDPLPAKPELLAWYPFCGDAIDRTGLGNDLINGGGPTVPAILTTDRFGNLNNAYRFNGVNSMMRHTTFFGPTGTPPDFTYSLWINPTSNQSSFVVYNGNTATNGYGIAMNNGTMGTPGNQVGVYFGTSGNLYASQPITVGSWHHLVLVKTGILYTFYIDNGVGVTFVELNAPLLSEVFALGINYHSTLPGNGPVRDAFDGAIDDVAIIDRPLTSTEIMSAYYYNPDVLNFSLGNDTLICADNITLAPIPQTAGGQYVWRRFVGGSGFPIFDTVHTSVTVYPNLGPSNRYVLVISKPYGCTTTDTIRVTKSPIPVNLGPDLIACDGDTITLTNYFPTASFLWSTGDTAHSIQVTGTGTYYVTVDSTYNGSTCLGRDTVNIQYHAVPIILLGPATAHCDGSPLVLHAHYDPAYTYLWSLGSTVDSMTATSSGTYWVRVNDSGCIRTDTIQSIVVWDTVSFFMPDTAICRGGRVEIKDRVTVNSLPGISYQWTPTAGVSTSNAPSPVIIPDTSAWYHLTVKYPGCPDFVDSFFIDVQPNPSVVIGGNRDVCRGDTIHIDASVNPAWYGHYIYNWAPSTSLDCSTCSSVIFTPGDTVKLILTVTTPAWNLAVPIGCIGKDSAWVFVHQNHFDSLPKLHYLCPRDSIQLTVYDTSTQGSFNAAYHWSPGIYLDDSTAAQPWVKPITSQEYRLVATSQFGCHDSMFVNILVYPDAVINLGDSVTIYPGESYHITPQTNCTYFTWYPPLGLDDEFISDPTATPNVNTVYHVTAITEAGCVIEDSLKIRVNPTSLLTMPNAFSPGSGYNNTFSLINRGIIALDHFRIFDRWGVMVFETKNINVGWDGTFNGKPQPFGVYVYEIEAQLNTGRKVKRQGNVTLIR